MTPDEILHRLTFDRLEDGAAFVAALSRFAASPGNVPERAGAWHTPLTVLADHDARTDTLDVYLNDVALEIATLGFGHPPVVATSVTSELPATCVVLLHDGARGAYGRDDVVRMITHASVNDS